MERPCHLCPIGKEYRKHQKTGRAGKQTPYPNEQYFPASLLQLPTQGNEDGRLTANRAVSNGRSDSRVITRQVGRLYADELVERVIYGGVVVGKISQVHLCT